MVVRGLADSCHLSKAGGWKPLPANLLFTTTAWDKHYMKNSSLIHAPGEKEANTICENFTLIDLNKCSQALKQANTLDSVRQKHLNLISSSATRCKMAKWLNVFLEINMGQKCNV